jgi:hypothetical protein
MTPETLNMHNSKWPKAKKLFYLYIPQNKKIYLVKGFYKKNYVLGSFYIKKYVRASTPAWGLLYT